MHYMSRFIFFAVLLAVLGILFHGANMKKATKQYPFPLYKTIRLGEGMWGVAWSPNSQKLTATYHMAGKVAIWDLNSGQKIQTVMAGGSAPQIFFLR